MLSVLVHLHFIVPAHQNVVYTVFWDLESWTRSLHNSTSLLWTGIFLLYVHASVSMIVWVLNEYECVWFMLHVMVWELNFRGALFYILGPLARCWVRYSMAKLKITDSHWLNDVVFASQSKCKLWGSIRSFNFSRLRVFSCQFGSLGSNPCWAPRWVCHCN